MNKEISCRITRTLLMYVREKNNGSIDKLLDGLKLDEDYLFDPNNWVSHALLQQLYKRMVGLLGDSKAVYNMALASERFQSLDILDRIVRLFGNPKHIYIQAPKYNKFLKLNGSVIIHEKGRSWVILEDRYHDPKQKTRFDCDYTRGILAGIPTMFGMPLAEVEEIKCQVAYERYGRRVWPDSPPQGCECCLYRVRWQPEKLPFLKRFTTQQDHYRQAIEDLVQANQLVQSKYDEIKRLMAKLELKNQQLRESRDTLEAQKEELIESERKYRNLFEYGSDLLCIHDLKGNLLETNLQYKEKYGWHREELEGLNIRQLIPDRHKRKLDDYLARIIANGSDEGYVKGFAKSGDEVILEYRNTLIVDDSGKPVAVQGAARDVTQRVRYEKEIKEGREKYNKVINSVPVGIYEFDYETMNSTNSTDPTNPMNQKFIDTIKGFLDPEEGKALFDIALEASQLGPCLEIGSYCGKSAVYLGSACHENGATLFSIDHHRGSEEQQPGEGYFDPALFDFKAFTVDTFPLFRKVLALASLEDTVVPIVSRSEVVARHWATPLSLVFIDGGHAFETARQDYHCWAGHIVGGGYLLIHDIFEKPEDGGQAPWEVYKMAVASGHFEEQPRIKSLGVLKRKED